jgi:hypothetical protein
VLRPANERQEHASIERVEACAAEPPTRQREPDRTHRGAQSRPRGEDAEQGEDAG